MVATLWRVRDWLGLEVVLTEVGWAHIMGRHANDLAGRQDDLREAVARADFITVDRDDPRRLCHYRRIGPGRIVLKVVVDYEPVPPPGTWTGRVITAHFRSETKKGEAPRWP